MKLLAVEAARGVAALMVVMLHAAHILGGAKDYGRQPFGGLFEFGRAGVDFFFVLSGFIIAHVHARDIGRPAAFAGFWQKRLLRIYPAYWAAFALWGLLLAISPTHGRAEQDGWYILGSAALVPEAGRVPILGVAWSIQHELLFYAVFSIAILSRRVGSGAFAAWFALTALNAGWMTFAGSPLLSGFPADFLLRVLNLQFLFGIAAAMLFRSQPAPCPRALATAGAILFVLTGLFESFVPARPHEWPPMHLAYATASAMILYGLAALDSARAIRVPAFMLELGTSSYSVYLVHVVFLLLAQQAIRYARPILGIPLELAFVLSVAFAALGGIAFSRLVERPLLRMGRRAIGAKPRLAQAEPNAG